MSIKRIIPCLDLKDGRVVKGVQFENLTDIGDPVACALAYDKAGADELAFLDIVGSPNSRRIMLDIVSRIAEQVAVPITVGGGMRCVDDSRRILVAGANKVSVNSAVLENHNLINELTTKFGSKCVVVAIDAKRRLSGSGWDVYTNGGHINTGKDAVEWAVDVERRGAGEILLTSMDCDGTRSGYDTELTRAVSEAVRIPVIASGGAGAMEHFRDAITIGKADAVLAASLFHFGEIKISELKDYLRSQGIETSHS